VPLEVIFGIELAGTSDPGDCGRTDIGPGAGTCTRTRPGERDSSPNAGTGNGRGQMTGTGPDDDVARDTAAARGLPDAPEHTHGVEASSFVRASTWKSDEAVDTLGLASRLGALPGLLRAKGFARSTRERVEAPPRDDQVVLVQAVGGQVECTPWPPSPDSAEPVGSVLTVLTTPDVGDATIAAALSGWRRVDPR
jgi:hypothetical protein